MARRTTSSNASYMAISNKGMAVKRIRSPTSSDVLLGRGGGINGHPGNKVFREWVRVRKEDYNLAPNKHEKTRVAKQVMDLVRQQTPPGRFLCRDSNSSAVVSMTHGSWWVEVDEARALAKTSQALREGAPQIRAAHGTDLHPVKRVKTTTPKPASRKPKAPTLPAVVLPKPAAPLAATVSRLAPAAWPQTVPALPHTPRPGPTAATGTPANVPQTTNDGISAQNALNELGRNLKEAQSMVTTAATTTSAQPAAATTFTPIVPVGSSIRPLMSNREFQQTYQNQREAKRPRTLERPTQHGSSSSQSESQAPQAIDGSADTPPLLPSPAIPSSVPPLSLDPSTKPLPSWGERSNLKRTHSLAMSDLPGWDASVMMDDFVNPFLDESDVANLIMNSSSNNNNHNHGSSRSPMTPRNHQPLVRNVSSDSGSREDYKSLLGLFDDDDHRTEPSTNDNTAPQPSDFNEQVKTLLDEDADNDMPTLLIPWRGGSLQRRYGSASSMGGTWSISGNDRGFNQRQ